MLGYSRGANGTMHVSQDDVVIVQDTQRGREDIGMGTNVILPGEFSRELPTPRSHHFLQGGNRRSTCILFALRIESHGDDVAE